MKAWRKRRDEAIQKANILLPKPSTPAHRKVGSDVFLRVTKGAPKLYTHQFIDRQGQIVPPANVAEETDVTDDMVELALANDDMELHEPTASMKAKEADESFHPGSRFGNGNAAFPWPTLVIEIGNAQSLAKMREDVRWWFENSKGDVRIVLLMIVHQRSRTITLEKWQLAPPNTSPLTRASINAFRQAVPPTMPPLVRQIAVDQQPYCIQEITITRTAASAQLMLPFHALLDDAPVPPQSDLVFTQAELVLMAQRTWR